MGRGGVQENGKSPANICPGPYLLFYRWLTRAKHLRKGTIIKANSWKGAEDERTKAGLKQALDFWPP